MALNTAVDLGPEGEHFRVFMDQINECGGIHGRQIEVNIYRFDPINFPQQDATCIEATAEDENLLVVARILTREAPLCIVEQNETPLITSSQFPREFYDRADGRLFGVDPTGDELLDLIARDLVATEVLGPDSVLGILSPDTPAETFAVRTASSPHSKNSASTTSTSSSPPPAWPATATTPPSAASRKPASPTSCPPSGPRATRRSCSKPPHSAGSPNTSPHRSGA